MLAVTPFDAILDRTLRNDRGKRTDGEELISRYRSTTPSYRPVYRFSSTCQGQAAFGGDCVSAARGNAPRCTFLYPLQNQHKMHPDAPACTKLHPDRDCIKVTVQSHNCTAILIQCVSGLRCSSFLSKPLRHRHCYTKALLSIPCENHEKWFRRALNPPHSYTKAVWSGALLHDCSELSCNSGRRIFVMFPSRRRKQTGVEEGQRRLSFAL